MIAAEAERPKDGPEAFEDAVTVELCDLDRGVCALLRLTRAAEGASASALALACLGNQTAATLDERGLQAPIEDWERAAAAGLELETAEPLGRWRCRFERGDVVLEAELQAVSAPIDFTAELTRLSGVRRYEQLCRVRGEVRAGGRRHEIDGVGRRTHAWGEPSDGRLRSLYAVAGEQAITVAAIQPPASDGHGAELIAAHLLRPESEPERFEQARLSTVYDSAGGPRTAGLELFMPGDEYPRRAAGAAVWSAAAGAEPFHVACFRWSLEQEPAQGGYQMAAL